MDPTTADFNAWLAEEGAKIGATVPPQPTSLLAMYGTGYAPSDSHDQSTADVLSRMQGGTEFGNLLRSLAPEVRQADDSTVASGILSRLARTGTGMVHSGLNTTANWLEKRPEVGPDTLAPLGLAPMGALVGHSSSLAKPSVADHARARYLEWKHPDDFPAVSGGEGQFNSAKYLAEADRMARENPHSIRNAAEPIATDPDAAVINNYSRNVYKTHNDVLEAIEQLQKAPASAERDAALAEYRQMRFRTASLLDELEPPEFVPANEPGKRTDRLRLLSDQSRASVPGTLINAMDLERAKPASSDAAKPTVRDHALAQGKEDLWAKSQISGMSEFADRMITNPDDWRRRMDAGFDFLNDVSPSKYLNARNDTGSVPGTVVNALAESQKPQGIRAYHGSPHDFDKFDTTKIGTGEGAQAYGHGLYFAEKEGVARQYRDNLGRNAQLRDAAFNPDGTPNRAGMVAQNLDANIPEEEILAGLKVLEPSATPAQLQEIMAKGRALFNEADKSGRMYEVRINADPESFLDWDKPLSQQSEAVRKALEPLIDEARGGTFNAPQRNGLQGFVDSDPSKGDALNFMGAISRARAGANKTDPAIASNALRDAGIPGIKYLDQGSRGNAFKVELFTSKGEKYAENVFPSAADAQRYADAKSAEGFKTNMVDQGSRNYVVFDADKIEILKKYGWVPAGMVGGGMMMTPPDGQSALPKEITQ